MAEHTNDGLNKEKENKLFFLCREEFISATGCNESKATKIITKYFRVVANELIKGMGKRSNSVNGLRTYIIDRKAIEKAMGSTTVDKHRYYIPTVMDELPTKILSIIKLGDNLRGIQTMVAINKDFEEQLIQSGDAMELCHELYKDVPDDAEIDYVKIDQKSLQSFINWAEHGLSKKDENDSVLHTYWKEAVRIKLISSVTDDTLPQEVAVNNSARRYYKGPNLQNISTIVRKAALGKCYEMDLDNSVYSWKAEMYTFITGAILPYHIQEYLESKQLIRSKLAMKLFATDDQWAIDLVKQALTAMSFGAKLSSHAYIKSKDTIHTPALKSIIYPHERFDMFASDPFIKGFYEDCQLVDKVLVTHMTNEIGKDYILSQEHLCTESGRISGPRLISWVYHIYEAQTMKVVVDALEAEGNEVLLQVHDAVYMKSKAGLASARMALNSQSSFYTMSCDDIEPYGFIYRSIMDEFVKEEQEHKQRMAEQELIAQRRYSIDPNMIN